MRNQPDDVLNMFLNFVSDTRNMLLEVYFAYFIINKTVKICQVVN